MPVLEVKRFDIGGQEDRVPMYQSYPVRRSAIGEALWSAKGILDGFVIWAARKVTQSVGEAVGGAWITIVGMVAAGAVVGMAGFAIHSSVQIADLNARQTYMQSDLRDMKNDLRDIKNRLGDNGNWRPQGSDSPGR